jgi:hypothetical protein
MTCINHKTQSFHKELSERIKITQVELWTVEVSLDTQARKLQKDLATIRYNHLRDYNLTHIKAQAMRNKTCSEIEATRCKFQSKLEVVEARAERGRGPEVSTSPAQAPTFDGTTSWATFQRQFETTAEHNHWTHQKKMEANLRKIITDMRAG